MISDRHQQEAELFFRHIADHGRFNEVQLYCFVELRTGESLVPDERTALIAYAREQGARREKGIAEVYQLPTERRVSRRRSRCGGEEQLVLRPANDNHAAPTWGKR